MSLEEWGWDSYFNEKYKDLTGVTPENLHGNVFYEFFGKDGDFFVNNMNSFLNFSDFDKILKFVADFL